MYGHYDPSVVYKFLQFWFNVSHFSHNLDTSHPVIKLHTPNMSPMSKPVKKYRFESLFEICKHTHTVSHYSFIKIINNEQIGWSNSVAAEPSALHICAHSLMTKTHVYDAANEMSGNDAIPRDLTMVIFFWSTREVRVRVLQSIKLFYRFSWDVESALGLCVKLKEVIFISLL